MKLAKRFVLVALCVASLALPAFAADLLASWNDGKAKQSIIVFVEKVTKSGSPDFVPPAERIATFDNDGTLWAEQISVLDTAVDDYIRAQRGNEDMAPYHINIGVAHRQRSRPEKAEAAFRDAIRIDPAFAPAYVNLVAVMSENAEAKRLLEEIRAKGGGIN